MIQTFVSKDKMVKYIGDDSLKSVSLSALFGGISSSCSFAALAAGKSLFKKGAHFIPTLAFLFVSTNLVVEIGILIYIFLGWQFVIAEIIGEFFLFLLCGVL
ncbi:permease [Guptibacillus hwajinpoensis]|uniref:permease n=1 Tax=Guptibacillus hwajinpoensis TaxID=208199 RepID=UPI00350FF339